MDTCNKINEYMQSVGYECRVMGVPKTIDNDLFGTDHCPGYASAAKYIATSLMEVYQDAHVYDTGMIVVMEIMGRHAGWLTAASALAGGIRRGSRPDLPARDGFRACPASSRTSSASMQEKGNCIVAVSEGIHYEDGGYRLRGEGLCERRLRPRPARRSRRHPRRRCSRRRRAPRSAASS